MSSDFYDGNPDEPEIKEIPIQRVRLWASDESLKLSEEYACPIQADGQITDELVLGALFHCEYMEGLDFKMSRGKLPLEEFSIDPNNKSVRYARHKGVVFAAFKEVKYD